MLKLIHHALYVHDVIDVWTIHLSLKLSVWRWYVTSADRRYWPTEVIDMKRVKLTTGAEVAVKKEALVAADEEMITPDSPTDYEHPTKETGTGPAYKCSVCPYATEKKYLLTRHVKTHTDDRPHQCSTCPQNFKVCHPSIDPCP